MSFTNNFQFVAMHEDSLSLAQIPQPDGLKDHRWVQILHSRKLENPNIRN